MAVGAGGGREIAVSPSGRFLAYKHGTRLVLADARGGAASFVEGLSSPEVVAFWARGEGLYSLSTTRRGERGEATESEIVAVEREKSAVVWRTVVPGGYASMLPLSSGKGLIVAGASGVLSLDEASGKISGRLSVEGAVVDVDEASGGRVVVTEAPRPAQSPTGEVQPDEGPSAIVRVLDAGGLGEVCRVRLANCADELTVSPEGERAFLAPTFCGRDPVSVVSLRDCSLSAQLPGFGPVALLRAGSLAVAFADREARDPGAPPLPDEVLKSSSRYHLMLIDARSLSYETVPVGERLPRFAPTPGDRLLLLDTAQKPPSQIQVLDVERRTLERVWGPAVPLSAYVLTPDARHAFVLSDGLYDLDLASLELRSLPLSFVPTAINITPDGATLLARDERGRVHLLGTSPLGSRGLVTPPEGG